jgi:hypothetical protein
LYDRPKSESVAFEQHLNEIDRIAGCSRRMMVRRNAAETVICDGSLYWLGEIGVARPARRRSLARRDALRRVKWDRARPGGRALFHFSRSENLTCRAVQGHRQPQARPYLALDNDQAAFLTGTARREDDRNCTRRRFGRGTARNEPANITGHLRGRTTKERHGR